MITLKHLQDVGALPVVLEDVKFSSGITLSNAISSEKDKSLNTKEPVILDHCIWAATKDRMPLVKADVVYSCDGKSLGSWNRATLSFTKMHFDADRLVPIKQFKFKEDSKMDAKANAEIMSQLEGIIGENEGVQKVHGFDEQEEKKETKELTPEQKEAKAAREAKLAAKRSEIDAIKKRGEGTVVEHSRHIINNKDKGRLLFFITKKNPVVKVSLSKTPIIGPDGKPVLSKSATPEARKKYESGKKVDASQLERESKFTFSEAKPPTPIGMVVKTPAATEAALTEVFADKLEINKVDDPNAFVVNVMSKETFFPYLAFNYDGVIREAEDILGKKATVLRQVMTQKMVEGKNGGPDNLIIQSSIKADPIEGVRKSLFVEGNYFPLETYVTSPVATADAETKKLLNNNFAALIKNFNTPRANSTKGVIAEGQIGENGLVTIVKEDKETLEYEVTSKFVDGGEPISVKSYYDKNVDVADVRLPLRKVTKNENTGKIRYTYVTNTLESENGPLNDPKYAPLIKLTGLSKDAFAAKLKSLTTSAKKTKGKDTSLEITPEMYLAFKGKAGNIADGSHALAELQSIIQGVEI